MKYNKVQDSGKRQNFKTGSVRDTREGKGRYDLLPFYALERIAMHYENGAVKYGDRNWELGQPLARYFDSCLRHLSKWMQGYDSEDHLSAAVWNIFAIIYTENRIQSGKLPQELLEGLPDEVKERISKEIRKKTNEKDK